jgi:hypothetical protein
LGFFAALAENKIALKKKKINNLLNPVQIEGMEKNIPHGCKRTSTVNKH